MKWAHNRIEGTVGHGQPVETEVDVLDVREPIIPKINLTIIKIILLVLITSWSRDCDRSRESRRGKEASRCRTPWWSLWTSWRSSACFSDTLSYCPWSLQEWCLSRDFFLEFINYDDSDKNKWMMMLFTHLHVAESHVDHRRDVGDKEKYQIVTGKYKLWIDLGKWDIIIIM